MVAAREKSTAHKKRKEKKKRNGTEQQHHCMRRIPCINELSSLWGTPVNSLREKRIVSHRIASCHVGIRGMS